MLMERDMVVSCRELRMMYGDRVVLDGVDLDIPRGQTVALLGPNGAGKTTTVEILEGFRRPSSGHVEVLGQDPARAPEAWRARVGVVLQSWRDHGTWRVHELLDVIGGYYAPYSTPQIRRPWPTEELLERVGLSEHARQRIDSLSGGQRRRLDVAAGLVGRPELLFLDEPTTGLDPAGRRDVHDLLSDVADLETTVLMTTHDLAEAETVADRLLILAGGTIVADGTPDALRLGLSRSSEVRLRDLSTGEVSVHAEPDPTAYLATVLATRADEVQVVEVRAASLEDVYLDIVQHSDAGKSLTQLEALAPRPTPGAALGATPEETSR
ncbi:MAG: ABC transporter ATP-binding protein [Ornithinimicrobium sp.]|uniref:ABC transporter ATP-binding protein n=1 Tax=Ornithinimicrobium sp. TaxID=1977084 RepID=UPI0026E0EB93|nr:ABC transporter ATP-binding protein [Ornithinimicrobium sp.]MDO5739177.1 ABC transporter ATP-binding protein [Ornithinimicrobium sp.]